MDKSTLTDLNVVYSKKYRKALFIIQLCTRQFTRHIEFNSDTTAVYGV